MTFKEFIILKENIYPFHCKKKLNEKGMLVSAISAPKGESICFQNGEFLLLLTAQSCFRN